MKKMIACLSILSMATTVWASLSFGQTPPDSDFYNPVFGTDTVTFSPTNTGDDTAMFNSALASLSASGGGTVEVDAGTYNFRGVQLQSNVHLRFDSGATILPAAGTSRDIFLANNNAGPVTNFSIASSDGGKFNIDYSSLGTSGEMRAISFGNASNFSISDFHVTDSQTKFSALSFGPNAQYGTNAVDGFPNILQIRGVPNQGIIENLSTIGAHFGYGLVQVQAGNHLLFRDLEAQGGVTLRLETGFERNQYVDRLPGQDLNQAEAIALDQIFGRDLLSTNGQAGLVLSPHTLDHGVVDIDGVETISSETGVNVAPGFVSRKATSQQVPAGLTPGSFAAGSKIRNVKVTFGQDAQLHKSKNNRFLPDQLREARVNGVGIGDAILDEFRIGPSIAAVLQKWDKPLTDYMVDFPVSEVEAIGFNIDGHALPENAFFVDAFDDFENIDGTKTSIAGTDISFFVSSDLRNTPNRQLAPILPGDVNLDDAVNFLDISPFILILSVGEFQDEADVNQDGVVDFLDISPFIALLSAP